MSDVGDTRLGDPSDWVLENLGWVRGLCLRLVGHADLADDVSQEVWVRLVKSPPPAGVAAPRWIAGVVKKVAAELGRKERAGKRREVEVATERKRESDARLSRQLEVERDVVEQIETLDEPYRRAVLQRYFDKLTIEDIGATEGLTPSGVRSRLSRAVEQLRDRLREEPNSVAGVFFGALLPEKYAAAAGVTASGKGSGSAAAWWSGKGLFLAALLVAVVGGVLHATLRAPAILTPQPSPGGLGGGGLGRGEVDPVDPVAGELVATGDGPEERAAPAGASSLGSTDSASGLDAAVEPDLTIQFVDVSGVPLTDLPIAAAKGVGSQLLRPIWKGATDTLRGELRVSPGDLVAPAKRRAGQPEMVEFFVDAPGHSGGVLAIDLHEVTAEPILVTIDVPMGAIVLHAQDGDGSPFQRVVEVGLSCLEPGTVFGRYSRSFDGGQPATLRGIPLGMQIAVSPLASQGLRAPMQMVDALTEGRRVAEVTLVFGADGPSLAATLLLPSGAVLAEPVGVSVLMKIGSDVVKGRVQVGEAGRVEATFKGMFEPGQPCEFQIVAAPKGKRAMVVGATVAAAVPFEGTPLELGALQLELKVRSVHGRVVDGSGAPCAGATVMVGREVDRTPGRFLPLTLERYAAGADGRFTLDIPSDGKRYALRAKSAKASTRSEYVPVDPGASSVELRLRPSSTVTGRVVVPEGPEPESLYVVWRRAGQDGDSGLSPVGVALNAARTFSLADIPAGTVDLALLRSREGGPASWRRGIEVPQDGSTVTLEDWVVDWDLVPLEFAVVYPEGVEPVAMVHVAGETDLLSGDKYEGWAPSVGGTLTVACEGCRTYWGSTATVGATIELEPAYTVSLELKLPKGWRASLGRQLSAQLRLVENDELGLATKRILPPRLAEGFTRPVSEIAAVTAEGRVQFRVSDPGELRVLLRLGTGSGTRVIKGPKLLPSLENLRITVDPGEPVQHFTLDLR